MVPVPTASRMRPRRTRAKVWDCQLRRDPRVKMVMEVMTISRVEKRLVRKPVRGTMTPMTSWKTEVSHWPVVSEIPNS